MARHKGINFTTEQIEELDALEKSVKALIDAMVPACIALDRIKHLGYFKLTHPTWLDYVRGRWKLTLRGLSYIMIRAASEDRKAMGIRRVQVQPKTLQDADFASDAMVRAIAAGGDVASFGVDAVVAKLREAREIVVARVMVENEGRVDFADWLDRLRSLATDLQAIKDQPSHANPRS